MLRVSYLVDDTYLKECMSCFHLMIIREDLPFLYGVSGALEVLNLVYVGFNVGPGV